MYSATSLLKHIEMSNSVEQYYGCFFIIFRTSSLSVCYSINFSVGKLSGSNLMLISENLLGDFTVTRLAVLLKSLLIPLAFRYKQQWCQDPKYSRSISKFPCQPLLLLEFKTFL